MLMMIYFVHKEFPISKNCIILILINASTKYYKTIDWDLS